MKGMCWWAHFHGDKLTVLMFSCGSHAETQQEANSHSQDDVAFSTCCCHYLKKPLQLPHSIGSGDSHLMLSKMHLGCCCLHCAFPTHTTFWPWDRQYLVIPSLWYLASSNILRNCCFQLAWVAFCNIAEHFRYPDGNCQHFAWRNKAARISALPWRWRSLDALRGHMSTLH